MPETEPKHTPEQKIVSSALDWRRRDKDAIANKGDGTLKRAEFDARQGLREAVDIYERRHP